jgi:hypothetical protein
MSDEPENQVEPREAKASVLPVPEFVVRTNTLAEVLGNIRDPRFWIQTEALVQLIIDNPSLRGMVYGYVSEAAFAAFLDDLGIKKHFKPDDHKKTKSDRTIDRNGRRYTIQLKSLQTNALREIEPGRFSGKVQNDASDRRKIELPGGDTIETTCYKAGEYDVLGVSLQPFTGAWRFAFKKNKDLKRSTYRKYPVAVQQMLLATLEDITFPLSDDWTENLLSLLDDHELGTPIEQPMDQ